MRRHAHLLAAGMRVLARVLRAIAGAPDYERYLAHMRAHHPSRATLTAREFAEQRWQERYSRPGSRCC